MRVVIDTNDFISALIGKRHRIKLQKVLLNPNVAILADETLLAEIRDVAYREKSRKYVSIDEVEEFLALLP